MRNIAFVLLVLLVAVGAGAKEVYTDLQAHNIVGFPFRDEVTLLYECVEFCQIPDGWTVVNGGTDAAGYSWDNPYGCGQGVVTCPPNDPDEGRSFLCPYGVAGELQDEWLISPAVSLDRDLTSLTLSFAHGVMYWSYCTHPNYVLVSVDGGANYDIVWTMDCADDYTDGTIYYENVNLDEYVEGGGRVDMIIAFQYQGDWAESWWVDEVTLTGSTITPVEDSTWSTIKGIYR